MARGMNMYMIKPCVDWSVQMVGVWVFLILVTFLSVVSEIFLKSKILGGGRSLS